ncbi:MAG: alpha/beta hydrolase [bacterium]
MAVSDHIMDMPFRAERRVAEWGVQFLLEAAKVAAGVECAVGTQDVLDVAYGKFSEQRLDVHVPANAQDAPIVVHVHGGGFRMLSKETHRHVALKFRDAGFLTVNVEYRKAPGARFPSAHQDFAAALQWVARHAADLGGDVTRVILVGESAGAHILTSWMLDQHASHPRFQRAALTVRGFVPICGLFAISPQFRGSERLTVPARLEVERVHLTARGENDLRYDPAVMAQMLAFPDLPPSLIVAGDSDPLWFQSQDLRTSLARQSDSTLQTFDGGHGFHFFTWTDSSRAAFASILAFAHECTRN